MAKKDACLAQSERKGWRGRLVGEAGACTRFGRLARRTKREGSHLGQMEQRGYRPVSRWPQVVPCGPSAGWEPAGFSAQDSNFTLRWPVTTEGI